MSSVACTACLMRSSVSRIVITSEREGVCEGKYHCQASNNSFETYLFSDRLKTKRFKCIFLVKYKVPARISLRSYFTNSRGIYGRARRAVRETSKKNAERTEHDGSRERWSPQQHPEATVGAGTGACWPTETTVNRCGQKLRRLKAII